MERYNLHYTENRPGCQMLKRSGKKSEKGVDNGAAVCYYNLALREQSQYRGVEQLVARRAHNPEVVGSSPSPATKSVTVVDTISTTVIFYLFSFWGCFWKETGDISNIPSHKQIVCPDLMRPWSEKAGLGKIEIVIRI